MAEYIDKSKMYENIAHLEEVARRKFLDTMSGDVKKELYRAQLSERTAIKHMVMDMPAADVAPVVHGKWKEITCTMNDILQERPPFLIVSGYKCSVCGRYEEEMEPYCNCGAKMDL